MKDDFSQDEKNPSNTKQSENLSSVNDDSLDWAKQAYLQLKQKQKEKKEIDEKEKIKTKNNVNEDLKLNFINKSNAECC